jgi:ABC-type uncharacterized transport system permease subunit
MQSSDLPQISTEEKIKILLHEYATLRQEIIARTGHGFQLMSVGSVLLAWVIITQTRASLFWPALAIAVTVFLVAAWFTLRDIRKAATRIQELEKDINRRAGEELLVWESKWGGVVTGFWGRARPLDRKTQENV